MRNILDDFLVKKGDTGYYCKYGDFYIDAMLPVERNIISHAHGDHATAGHRRMYATLPTFAFMKNKYPKMTDASQHVVSYGDPLQFGDVRVTLFPAGHMLGSAQILMEFEDVRYLYTGDYKLQNDITCEPIEVRKADVLITESTFANPAVKHPDFREEILKLKDRQSNIMLGCYVLGKAQRLTALINTYLPEREVLVHHKMYPVHRLYDQLGRCRLKYTLYNRKAMKDAPGNKIYLVPPLTFNSYFRAKNVLRAFASGWERLQRQNDITLYISDHVDWDDLLRFINDVQPQQVWTIHGDGKALQHHFAGELIVRDILQAG
ncbi:putative mRNA 3-end processing factor [Sphingobacterium allocomposti]|uniref:Putative mRNA 3-end processing factor n=1 Tax=Sphingobacterium allocomposti TaxID=415956 RepID=A0A5S5DCB3_9SPHI|nr:MBL fold metallo-hydrolase RNA specificity domain-containing protein [Sphingobacterium composti Yoo et al. 2007 non Ten et al. 2007]TYP93144.1 putative mRNA 3-end processing factor [Sphingobacterium composti Yoo et al. 2007 non Ten et al. 2007]